MSFTSLLITWMLVKMLSAHHLYFLEIVYLSIVDIVLWIIFAFENITSVVEIFVLLRLYTLQIGSWLVTLWDNISGHSSRVIVQE